MAKGLMSFYQNSDRFRRYVDRCAANFHDDRYTVGKVLELALTREVARSYMEEEPGQGHAAASTYTPVGECV